jgi:predicted nucleotidyltransferase component of viral defense system
MNNDKIIERRLLQYEIQTKQDELNALKEIFQEIALSALSRTDFFKQAGFQGGTCLRVLYGLQRFSEDLDFILLSQNPTFDWDPFLNRIQEEFRSYNLNLESKDRSKTTGPVKKVFIKEDSFGQILNLTYARDRSDIQKIQIKLEIDTHPPTGSDFESKFLDFPYPYSITLQDLKSLFAGKCHALLCRTYTKGRDWFDFVWYASQRTKLNYVFLQNALHQTGPWQGKKVDVNKEWVAESLKDKILATDWETAKKDVEKFLKPRELESLKLWGKEFFLSCLEKII